ncbi:sensor domain-containing protein [Desulforhopalus singaporensis]|uniref:PAS domain S-box-containing protein/diguanylate cyclase (GGDEF) domain-containing protein n=1 Tax=Desulforhopalus singaporensis TaxID=91360 RepID=A0A1H0UJM0_9BACT|nr:GGDEF and EAL domain-containing protein [Desulforhopalus singaporensis]SDP66389.1 PAS domain S-box-containing protein/diguanylate cyclase (GGDEF) domain-containing protein [Desulforhopalus singaporensis]
MQRGYDDFVVLRCATEKLLLRALPNMKSVNFPNNVLADEDNAVPIVTVSGCRQDIFLACPAVVYLCHGDNDFAITFVSDNIKHQFGYERSDFEGKSAFWLDRIHPDDRARVIKNLATLPASETVIQEYRLLNKKGRYRWVRDELRMVASKDGGGREIVGSWLDITEHKVIEQKLRTSRAYLEEVQRIGRIGSWDWDIENNSFHCSAEFYRILGADPDTFVFSIDALCGAVHRENQAQVRMELEKALASGGSYSINCRIDSGDSVTRYVYFQGQVTLGDGNQPVRATGTVLDVTDFKLIEQDLEKKQSHLNYLAYYDSLTGLPNRELFQDRLTRAVKRVERTKAMTALLFLDLDLFKKINDTMGHRAGDKLLLQVAERMTVHLRYAVDTIARFGGDEFVILIEDVSEIKYVARIAQRILNSLESPFFLDNRKCYVSASIGISVCRSSDEENESLLKRADVAMYEAKKCGRNTFRFYSREMDIRAHEFLLLENDLRQALENDEFILHYQPKLELSSGRVFGVEALLRWHHPEKGLIAPGDFIPLLEESGLIVPVGKKVLQSACAYAKSLQEAGIPPLQMSVNISMSQFKDPGFLTLVTEILQKTSLDPRLLELEITESVAMENVGETISRLKSLRQMGVCLAIDDFGKGFSSLNHLKHLPITTLKIDKGFVQDVHKDTRDLAIIEAILFVAQKIDCGVIAEGIETKEQLRLLCQAGCTKGQGYFFSKPLAEKEFAAYCAESDRIL